MSFRLSNHSARILEIFKELLEKKGEFYIWCNGDLLKEINDKLPSQLKLRPGQLIIFIYRFQKFYRVFHNRKSHETTSYIFIKRRNKTNETTSTRQLQES